MTLSDLGLFEAFSGTTLRNRFRTLNCTAPGSSCLFLCFLGARDVDSDGDHAGDLAGFDACFRLFRVFFLRTFFKPPTYGWVSGLYWEIGTSRP